jgi:hypothetical protein
VRGLSVFFSLCFPIAAVADGYNLPAQVKVLPVAFVPDGAAVPPPADQNLFLRHLNWSQERYAELLGGDTFELAQPTIAVVRGARPLDFYRNRPENGAPEIVVELLGHFKVTRFDNPYVFCILIANPRDDYPVGGGRTINGGYNSGGGMMFIASSQLRRNKHFQTTLQHELGHAFGLPHPDVYGYDIKTNPSIMSYSAANFTDNFKPSPTPGVLIPEDWRGLALNDRVFAKTTFDAGRDVTADYKLSPRIVPLGPMTLPGLPDFYPAVTTDAGEAVRSKVANVVMGEIKPSAGPGITYDPKNMWHSEKLPDRPAMLTFAFPFAVELTGIGIHSQHSALDHAVTAMKLETIDGDANRVVAEQKVAEIDATVTFPATTGTVWKLTLEPGKSRTIVIRGIRFLNGEREVVPHMVTYGPSLNP